MIMQYLEIEPTYKSPKVTFNPIEGKLVIEGRSVLEKVEEFYRPLLNWLDDYIKQVSQGPLEFIFDLEYVNLATTKRLLFCFYKLHKLQKKGIEVKVTWRYATNDKEALELGRDLAQMFSFTVDFVGYEKLHSREWLVSA
jgi:hypothetical protein